MPKPDRYPRRIEAAHQRLIRRFVVLFAPIVQSEVIDRLPEMYPQPVGDSAGAVTDDMTVLNDALGRLRLRWGDEVATEKRIQEVCNTSGHQLDLFNAASAQASLRSVGVKLIPGSYIENLMPNWIAEHTSLIVRGGVWRGKPTIPLGEQTITQIGETVNAGFTQGLRHEEVAREIKERLGVMQSRANLIGRDQVNKLNGKLTETRYTRAGIYRYTWTTSHEERVRQTHADLDGTQWDFRAPPTIGNPGQPIQCVPGKSRLAFSDGIHRAWRRRFGGNLTKIVPVLGEPVYCTPNHPVLTGSGWKPAHSVDVGDEIFHVANETRGVGNTDVDHVEPTIEKVFETLRSIFPMRGMPSLHADFHGDGSVDEDVDEVLVAWGLPDNLEPTQLKRVAQNILTDADMRLVSVPGCSDLAAVIDSFLHAPDGVIGGLSKFLAVVETGSAHSEVHRRTAAAHLDAMIAKHTADLGPAERRFVGDVLSATARKVLANNPRLTELFNLATWCHTSREVARLSAVVASVDNVNVSGIHVFNLQTKNGWYQTSAILHNCRCVAEPVFPKPGDPT